MSFDKLGLYEPILKALKQKGYKEPSPIQAKAIPAILEKRDVKNNFIVINLQKKGLTK